MRPGVGKTQLGLRWADTGRAEEGRRGVVCDLTSRGDCQNHAGYASRLFGWELSDYPSDAVARLRATSGTSPGRSAITSTRSPVRAPRDPRRTSSPTPGTNGRAELARILALLGRLLLPAFRPGAPRVVFDGIEPTERFSESIQFEFFEYIYHHVLRKEDEWAARELFREHYRARGSRCSRIATIIGTIGCLYLYTTPHVMLDDLIAQPIAQGDIFSNANTIILMGRTRHEGRVGRALSVAKHRGSACGDEILPYRITEHGLDLRVTAVSRLHL